MNVAFPFGSASGRGGFGAAFRLPIPQTRRPPHFAIVSAAEKRVIDILARRIARRQGQEAPGRSFGCYTDLVLLLQLLLTLTLLAVCSFAPGFLLVRRLRWSGLEKLCGSVALSLVLLWLACWGIYVFARPGACYGLAAPCGMAGVCGPHDAGGGVFGGGGG